MVLHVIIYFVIALVFTVILGGIQQQTGILPTLILPQWGPGLAGILMLLLFRKDSIAIQFEIKRNQVKAYLGSIFCPILITGIAILISLWILGDLHFSQLSLFPGVVIIGSTLFGAIGEEIGWRGYLQPTLNKKMNLLGSSLVVGGLWAAWHVNNFSYGPLFIIGFFLVILGYSVFISYLSKDNRFNLVVAVLFHWFINLSNSVVPTETLTSGHFMLTAGIVWAAAALLLVISHRKAFLTKA